MEDVTKNFSERLKKLRGDKTLQEVAKELGITRVSLGYYESGQRKPDINVLYALAKYYNVSADYLLGMTDIKTTNIEIKAIADKTGLSEMAINKICFYNSHSMGYTAPLNILLTSLNFESALYHIPIYMSAVKKTYKLHKQIISRYEEVLAAGPMGESGVYNWPYNDDLDKDHTENKREMEIQEYSIDKAFKYIIQELEQIAKEELN